MPASASDFNALEQLIKNCGDRNKLIELVNTDGDEHAFLTKLNAFSHSYNLPPTRLVLVGVPNGNDEINLDEINLDGNDEINDEINLEQLKELRELAFQKLVESSFNAARLTDELKTNLGNIIHLNPTNNNIRNIITAIKNNILGLTCNINDQVVSDANLKAFQRQALFKLFQSKLNMTIDNNTEVALRELIQTYNNDTQDNPANFRRVLRNKEEHLIGTTGRIETVIIDGDIAADFRRFSLEKLAFHAMKKIEIADANLLKTIINGDVNSIRTELNQHQDKFGNPGNGFFNIPNFVSNEFAQVLRSAALERLISLRLKEKVADLIGDNYHFLNKLMNMNSESPNSLKTILEDNENIFQLNQNNINTDNLINRGMMESIKFAVKNQIKELRAKRQGNFNTYRFQKPRVIEALHAAGTDQTKVDEVTNRVKAGGLIAKELEDISITVSHDINRQLNPNSPPPNPVVKEEKNAAGKNEQTVEGIIDDRAGGGKLIREELKPHEVKYTLKESGADMQRKIELLIKFMIHELKQKGIAEGERVTLSNIIPDDPEVVSQFKQAFIDAGYTNLYVPQEPVTASMTFGH